MHDLILFLHLSFLCVAVVGIVIADKAAFDWMRGRMRTIGTKTLFIAHWIVTIGLAGLILSGLYLFWPLRDDLLLQPLFWLKMFFVLALVINSFFIDYLMHIASLQAFASLVPSEKKPLIFSGVVSTVSWLGTVVVAFTLFRKFFFF